MKTKRICLYLGEEAKKRIDKLAKETGLKKSEIVRQALKQWEEQRNENNS